MPGRGTVIPVLTALLAAALLTPIALAAKPVIERIDIDEGGPDPFLTAECGFAVDVHFAGQIIARTFSGDGTGPAELRTLNILSTVTANGNTVRIRDVGVDLVRVFPDGTLILSIVGQVPFDFTGVLKVDLTTGEVIHEPQHLGDTVEEVCAALSA